LQVAEANGSVFVVICCVLLIVFCVLILICQNSGCVIEWCKDPRGLFKDQDYLIF